MAKTAAQRFREHLVRQQQRGLVRTTLWIPKGKKEEVQKLINEYTAKQAPTQEAQQ